MPGTLSAASSETTSSAPAGPDDVQALGDHPQPGAGDIDLPAPAPRETAHRVQQVAIHRHAQRGGRGVDVVLPEVPLYARPVSLDHQASEHRAIVDPGHGGEEALHDLGVGIHQPGSDLGGEDALQHQQAEGLVAGMAALAPAEKVVLNAMSRRPVGEGAEQRTPGGAAFAVGYRQIRDRLTDIVAQPGESRGQAPARLQLPALGGAAVEGEDAALTRLGRVEGDLEPVAEETACTAVVMRLRGREQMDEGGLALDHRAHQGGEARVREGQCVLQPGDQLALGGDDPYRCRDREPLQEGWVARDLGVIDERDIRLRGCGARRRLAAAEQSHPDMLHPTGGEP